MSQSIINDQISQQNIDKLKEDISLEVNYKNKQGTFHGITNEQNSDFYGPLINSDSQQQQVHEFHQVLQNDMNNDNKAIVSPQSNSTSSNRQSNVIQNRSKIQSDYDENAGNHPFNRVNSNEINHDQSIISGTGSGFKGSSSVMQNNIASHNFDKLSGNINIQSYLKNNNNPSQSINNFQNNATTLSQFKNKTHSEMINGPEFTNSSNHNSIVKVTKQYKDTNRPSLTAENIQNQSNIKNMGTIQISAVDIEEAEVSHELQKKAIFKLLRKFKLQQYAFKMDQYGFSDDVYKLSFLSHREREDLIENLNMLPGHRERINDLFKIVEQLNPKCSLKQTMLNAIKQSKQENRKKQEQSDSNYLRSDSQNNYNNRGRRDYDNKVVTSDEETVKNNKYSQRNVSSNKNYNNDSTSGAMTQNSSNIKMINRNKSSSITKRSAATGKSIGVIHESHNFNVNQIYTPVLAEVNASGHQFSTKIPHSVNKMQISNPLKKLSREQFMQNRQSTNTAARSLSKGKKKDRTEQSNSLNRIYNQLESKAKQALNQAFLNNIQQGRNYQNFHYALNNFANQIDEQKKAKKAIESIFPMRKFVINHLEQKQKQMKQNQKLQHQDSSVSKKISSSKEKKQRQDSKEINNSQVTPYTQIQVQKVARTSNQNNRPPLANYSSSAQKTVKKQSKQIPNFIQTNMKLQTETDSKIQNQTYTQFTKNEITKNQQKIGSHLNNQNILCMNNDPFIEQNEKQYENNNYEKYESPDKQDLQIIQREKSGQKNEKFMKQRIRSSSQSQKKIIGESQKNLFLQKTQQNQMVSHDEALFLSGNKKNMYRNSELKQDIFNSKNKNSNERKIQNIRPPLGQKGLNKPEANVRQLLSNRQLNLSSLNNSQNKQLMQSTAYQSGADSQINLKSRQKNQSNQKRQGGSYNRNMNSLQVLDSTNKESKNSFKNYILPDITSSRKANTESTTVNKKDSQRISSSQQQRSSQQNNMQLSKQSDRDTLVKYEKFNQPNQQVKNQQNKTFEIQRQGSPQYSTPSVPDQSLIQNKVQAYKFENVITIESPNVKLSYGQLHQDAVNDLSQPLLDKQEHDYAKNLGNSFNSKKVAVGPVFFNLRLICDCLGRAIRRHIDYSQGSFWFLDQLHEAKQIQKLIQKEKTLKNLQKLLKNESKQDVNIEESGSSELTAFSYKFKDELKLSLRRSKDDYYNEDELERSGNLDDDEEENKNSKSQFDKIKQALIKKSLLQDQEEISEQSIEDIDIEVQQQLNLKEEKQIEEIRLQEMMKQTGTLVSNDISTLNKSLENEKNQDGNQFKDLILKRPQVQVTESNKKNSDKNSSDSKSKNKQLQNKSYVQLQLIEKDKKIKELTKMVQMYETGKINRNRSPEKIQEVMIIGTTNQMRGASSFRSKNEDENDEDIIKKYEADIYKMTRAEFLMSQIDLDPIESHYSQEQQQLSSNINHVRQNIISGIGSNRFQQNQNQDDIKNFKSAERAQDEQNNATNGQENNATMLDGSFNSVSQGRSLNQSSGQNGHQILQSGELGDIVVDNNNTFKVLPKSNHVDQSKKGTNQDLKSVSKSSQNPIKKRDQQEKNKKVNLGIKSYNSQLQRFNREEQLAILQDQLRYFDERMEFDDEIYHEDCDIIEPSSEDIAAYCKYVTIASKMENETPVIALIYIERILMKTGILINKYNWKRILVICLCVASKVWDDDSLENIHFPKVMSDVSLLMINKLEQIFLDLFLNYDLIVKGSEYAKYYFIMRTLADDLRDECLTIEEKNAAINEGRRKKKRRDDWAEFPLIKPISAMQMQQLQRNTAKAEIYLKDRHEKEIIFALGNKFKGPGQKSRQKRFMMNGAEDIINVKYTEQEYSQKKPRCVTSDQILSSTL